MPATSPALVKRHFSDPQGTHPADLISWDTRNAWTEDSPYFNPGLEVPEDWSQESLDITSKLYLDKAKPEKSIADMVYRVVYKITKEGIDAGYFPGFSDGEDVGAPGTANHPATVFYCELTHVLLHQMAAFNSPVWFNIGREDRRQCPSACFLLGVDDTSKSIMKWVDDEVFIFKAGSGSGANLSRLRGSMEPLSTGGTASGPVSFMRIADAAAGTFKSGGTTRRAAKMVQLDVDHPDILEFIWAKPREEARLRTLAQAGVNIGFNEEGERNVAELTGYQNANVSVRVPDEFMNKATSEVFSQLGRWPLISRGEKRGHVALDSVDPGYVLDQIAQAAWDCADPGMMFHDTINRWHTTPNDAEIRTTNPCGETHLPDDSSCNLASINLLKFVGADGSFDTEGYCRVVDVMTTAMDILVEFCELPTPELTERTKQYRWLGLGYANLGAAIMAQGLAYDSPEARDFAAATAALLTGECYAQSAALAEKMGAFEGCEESRIHDVIQMHVDALPEESTEATEGKGIWAWAYGSWMRAGQHGLKHGYRNAQASVMAPTGSISFLMGCDTTGVEPAFSLIQHKQLAGGGTMKLINRSVERALTVLGYRTNMDPENLRQQRELDEVYIENEGYPNVMAKHRDVFAGANDISPMGHLLMVAAIQPFVSGGISKTINLSRNVRAKDIRALYVEAWRRGVKCISVYRDGSKARQVLSTQKREPEGDEVEWQSASTVEIISGIPPSRGGPQPVAEHFNEVGLMSEEIFEGDQYHHPSGAIGLDGPSQGSATFFLAGSSGTVSGTASVEEIAAAMTPSAEDQYEGPVGPQRRRMPRDANMFRHKFNVNGFEGYLLMGVYDDGTLGEIFLEDIGKEGTTLRGLLNTWAIQFSLSLQYGVPLEVLARKFSYMNFEPNGATENPEVPNARSIPDYILKVLVARFGDVDLQQELGVLTVAVKERKTLDLDAMERPPLEVTHWAWDGNGTYTATLPVSTPGVHRVVVPATSDLATTADLAPSSVAERHPGLAAVSTMASVHVSKEAASKLEMICPECGDFARPAGSCFTCTCGWSTGCG